MQLTDVLIGLGPYVVYYPRLCPILGGVNATIMLCHLIGWTGSQRDPDGWIYKTQAELERETGLSRREQDTARARLRQLAPRPHLDQPRGQARLAAARRPHRPVSGVIHAHHEELLATTGHRRLPESAHDHTSPDAADARSRAAYILKHTTAGY